MLPTLRLGVKGDTVNVAQLLTDYQFVNGDYDEPFKAHVVEWQNNHNLIADGVIGSATWTKIAQTAPTVSTSRLRNSTYAKAVQILVGVAADGIFGNGTKKAVVAFQSAKGLKADGIVGQKTWSALIGIEDVPTEKVLNECVHYTQYDKRWGKIMYSNHNDKNQTISNSGCGPTSMAQIVATFIDKSITPAEMAELALKGGYRTYKDGTAWGFYEYVYRNVKGFKKYIKTGSLSVLKAALAEGALAVCSMNNKDNNWWTSGGHFVTVIGYDGKNIYANDPNKSKAPRTQALSKFQTCMKQAFIFWR